MKKQWYKYISLYNRNNSMDDDAFEELYHHQWQIGTRNKLENTLVTATSDFPNLVLHLLEPYLAYVHKPSFHQWNAHVMEQRLIRGRKQTPIARKQCRIVIRRVVRDAERCLRLQRILDQVWVKVVEEMRSE